MKKYFLILNVVFIIIALAFLGEYGYDWARVMAAAVAASVPILFIFIFLQKYMIAGLTAGAVKE